MTVRFRRRKVADALVRPGGAVFEAMQTVVLAGAREAVRLVPRDTGLLANTIQGTVETEGTRAVGRISASTDYAAAVEFGTHSAGEAGAPGKVSLAPGGMPARPYLRPGLRAGIQYARRQGQIT